MSLKVFLLVFFFNDTATTEIYTLSLHDALPILSRRRRAERAREPAQHDRLVLGLAVDAEIAVGGIGVVDQVIERARAVVAVDAVGVARTAARERGAALAHLVDQARAARPVDPAEAQDDAGHPALAQHRLR